MIFNRTAEILIDNFGRDNIFLSTIANTSDEFYTAMSVLFTGILILIMNYSYINKEFNKFMKNHNIGDFDIFIRTHGGNILTYLFISGIFIFGIFGSDLLPNIINFLITNTLDTAGFYFIFSSNTTIHFIYLLSVIILLIISIFNILYNGLKVYGGVFEKKGKIIDYRKRLLTSIGGFLFIMFFMILGTIENIINTVFLKENVSIKEYINNEVNINK